LNNATVADQIYNLAVQLSVTVCPPNYITCLSG